MAMGGLTTVVLVDTNIWYSRTLRDWVGMCALWGPDGWFEVKWTEDILAELLYNLRKEYPMHSDRQIGGIRDQIVNSFANGRIEGFRIDAEVDYPDIYDAHVHAAAVHAGVDIILTEDKGFDQLGNRIDDLPYELHTADTFFCLLDDSSPKSIRLVVEQQLEYWTARRDNFNVCTWLENAGAPEFADRVRKHLRML